MPTLFAGTPAYGSLAIRADGRTTETEPLLHLDRYVATEFRAGYDGVVFKAVVAAVIRVLVQAELQKGSDSGGFFGALAKVVVPAAATIVTQADTRMWRALPHTIGLASLPRPADDILRIGAGDASAIGEVSLPPGRFVDRYGHHHPSGGVAGSEHLCPAGRLNVMKDSSVRACRSRRRIWPDAPLPVRNT